MPCERHSFRAVNFPPMQFTGNSLSLPFEGDPHSVPFECFSFRVVFRRLSFCASEPFFKGDSLSVQKSILGNSSLSVSFSGEYLSVLFLNEISESLPFSFRAVLRKESLGFSF